MFQRVHRYKGLLTTNCNESISRRHKIRNKRSYKSVCAFVQFHGDYNKPSKYSKSIASICSEKFRSFIESLYSEYFQLKGATAKMLINEIIYLYMNKNVQNGGLGYDISGKILTKPS